MKLEPIIQSEVNQKEKRSEERRVGKEVFKVKWTLGSINTNKASGSDRILAELF